MVISESDFLSVWEKQHSHVEVESIPLNGSVALSMLRLDQIHPQISGNKWFKLKYNILDALKQNKSTLLSFGGAYSNHLHALAYAGKVYGLKTIGIVRGEVQTNSTLSDCHAWGMDLHFISRSSYRQRREEDFLGDIQTTYPDAYVIPEGGYNAYGIKGCSEILHAEHLRSITHVACSVGTGATIEGLLQCLPENITVLGFSALKKCDDVHHALQKKDRAHEVHLFPDIMFGGFAKPHEDLIRFQKTFLQQHGITLDYVYTAKMMYRLLDLIEQGFIPSGSHVLAIHTGGVQGNRGFTIPC